jgi:glycosyltransferase involved in cell wall biosynthesis
MQGRDKPVVLIGFLTKGNHGPIPTVTEAFMSGLWEKYHFVAQTGNRRFGTKVLGTMNPVNVYYFAKHFAIWLLLLIRWRPDIAHYPVSSFWNLEKSITFLAVARVSGARTVGHLHGGAFVEFWRGLSPMRKRLAFKQLQALDAFVVLSDGWKRQVVGTVGLDPSSVFVVSNPINKEFEEAALRTPVPRTEKRILALGVMSREKGVLDILEATQELLPRAGWNLCLVGPEREPNILKVVRQTIQQYGLSDYVHVSTGVWAAEKILLYQKSSIFLLPSYHENLPLVIIEAAAAGLPIITTPVGALPDFFEGGRSLLYVEPGNTTQIRNAVSLLLDNASLRWQLGEAAREVFQTKLSRADILKSLDDVYHHVLSRKS